MKDKFYKIFGVVLIVLLFVAVVVTSVLISRKKDDTENIPEVELTSIVKVIS